MQRGKRERERPKERKRERVRRRERKRERVNETGEREEPGNDSLEGKREGSAGGLKLVNAKLETHYGRSAPVVRRTTDQWDTGVS